MNASAQPLHEDALTTAARAVADPTRRRILDLVRDEPRAAGELAAAFPHMSRPAVSQHLRVLEDAALVTVRRDGNRRLYSLRLDGFAAMRNYLDHMWDDRLARLRTAAEAAERKQR